MNAQRDAGREVSLYCGALPQANSVSLAAQFLGRMTTPSKAAVRAEFQLQAAVNGLEVDREIIGCDTSRSCPMARRPVLSARSNFRCDTLPFGVRWLDTAFFCFPILPIDSAPASEKA